MQLLASSSRSRPASSDGGGCSCRAASDHSSIAASLPLKPVTQRPAAASSCASHGCGGGAARLACAHSTCARGQGSSTSAGAVDTTACCRLDNCMPSTDTAARAAHLSNVAWRQPIQLLRQRGSKRIPPAVPQLQPQRGCCPCKGCQLLRARCTHDCGAGVAECRSPAGRRVALQLGCCPSSCRQLLAAVSAQLAAAGRPVAAPPGAAWPEAGGRPALQTAQQQAAAASTAASSVTATAAGPAGLRHGNQRLCLRTHPCHGRQLLRCCSQVIPACLARMLHQQLRPHRPPHAQHALLLHLHAHDASSMRS